MYMYGIYINFDTQPSLSLVCADPNLATTTAQPTTMATTTMATTTTATTVTLNDNTTSDTVTSDPVTNSLLHNMTNITGLYVIMM